MKIFKFLFLMPRRLSRTQYFIRFLFWFVFLCTPSIAATLFATIHTESHLNQNAITLGPLITICIYLISFVQLLICHISRLHDLNLSGWWLIPMGLINAIPGIGHVTAPITFIVMLFYPGTRDNNKFDFVVTQDEARVI